MEELKNCVFCGSPNVELIEKKSRGFAGRDKFSYYVKCHNCQARGPVGSSTGQKSETWRAFAAFTWNEAPRCAKEGV